MGTTNLNERMKVYQKERERKRRVVCETASYVEDEIEQR